MEYINILYQFIRGDLSKNPLFIEYDIILFLVKNINKLSSISYISVLGERLNL
jgi:hypothetical protein